MEKVRLINLPKLKDNRGSLSFVEGKNHIPFEIKRIFYLYENSEMERGDHAHKESEQFIIPINGSFDFCVTDGKEKKTFHLNDPSKGLYIPTMIWCNLKNFSSGSSCLVLSSDIYKEDDYYRNYQEFINAITNKN